jgi:hypothetical protein
VFKKGKKLNGNVAHQGVLLYYKRRLFINLRGSDDAIIIFGINRLGVFKGGI